MKDNEIYGDMRGVLRAYKLYESAKNLEVKQERLKTLQDLASAFKEKWNFKYNLNMSMAEWIRALNTKGDKNEEIQPRTR